jgi:hypothetical protein
MESKGSTDDDESEQQRCAETAKSKMELLLKLKKQTAFKDNVMKECRELFYQENLEEKIR